MAEPLIFLSWESLWPAQSGGDLRTLRLLRELSKRFKSMVSRLKNSVKGNAMGLEALDADLSRSVRLVRVGKFMKNCAIMPSVKGIGSNNRNFGGF